LQCIELAQNFREITRNRHWIRHGKLELFVGPNVNTERPVALSFGVRPSGR
jgi:hypothetical protein